MNIIFHIFISSELKFLEIIGNLIQKLRLIQIIRSSPAIGVDGTVYLGVSYIIYAFQPIYLVPKWNYSYSTGSGPAPFSNSLTVTENSIIYMGTTSNGLLLIKDEGSYASLLWIMGPTSVTTTPALTSNNEVLVGSSDFRLYSLNASTGDILWSFPTGI